MLRKISANENVLISFVLIVCAFFYILNAWSPSSYSLALNMIGENVTPDFGQARQIRTDEYWVQTPLTQALVRDGFHRYNSTSLYNEDLRINYGLPIFDWGMIFKPALWGYTIFPAPYAFSLYYFLLFIFFVLGYQLFFQKLGLEKKTAFLFSLSLYFSGAIQAWWTVNASTFAFFPWVMLSVVALRKNLIFGVALYYFLVSWQIGNLYPAFSYGLGLAGIVWLWIVMDKSQFTIKFISSASLAGFLAIVTVYFYFADYINMMKDTVYPGLRNVSGGDHLSLPMLFSLLIPSAWYDANFEVLIFKGMENICEISTLSTLLPSLLIFFSWGQKSINLSSMSVYLRNNILLIIISVLMLAWITLPIPAEIGKYVFLNKVPAKRLVLGFALLVSILCVLMVKKITIKISTTRLIIYWMLYLSICGIIKHSLIAMKLDFIAAVVTFFGMFLMFKFTKSDYLTIFGGCFLFSLCTFALFNPLQDARPIFAKHDTQLIRGLMNEQNSNGFVLGAGLPGAIANGLGFKSVAHVDTTPQLDFWRTKFPSLPAPLFNGIFNRYAHIQLYSEDNISTPSADVIRIPERCFDHGLHSICSKVDFVR